MQKTFSFLKPSLLVLTAVSSFNHSFAGKPVVDEDCLQIERADAQVPTADLGSLKEQLHTLGQKVDQLSNSQNQNYNQDNQDQNKQKDATVSGSELDPNLKLLAKVLQSGTVNAQIQAELLKATQALNAKKSTREKFVDWIWEHPKSSVALFLIAIAGTIARVCPELGSWVTSYTTWSGIKGSAMIAKGATKGILQAGGEVAREALQAGGELAEKAIDDATIDCFEALAPAAVEGVASAAAGDVAENAIKFSSLSIMDRFVTLVYLGAQKVGLAS